MSDLFRLAKLIDALALRGAHERLDLLIQEAQETGGSYRSSAEGTSAMTTLDLHDIEVSSPVQGHVANGWIGAALAVLEDARKREAEDMAWARRVIKGLEPIAGDKDVERACNMILWRSLIYRERSHARELLAGLQVAA